MSTRIPTLPIQHHRFSRNTFAVLCLFALSLLWSCEDKQDGAVELYQGPIEEIRDVRLLYSESGQLRVEVKTPLQYRYQSDDKVFPDTVNINFFDPASGTVVTTLRSDSGRFDNSSNLYIVKGNVRVVNKQKQQRLKTQELYWNPTTRKVYTEKDVLIENLMTGSYTKGRGLDAEQDFSYMSIRRPYGIFDVDPGM
jgi:LPS export ABC transporter protein LptC